MRPTLRPWPVLHIEAGLEHLAGPHDLEQLRTGGVVDRQRVGEELVDVAYEPDHFAQLGLTLLLDATDLVAVDIPDHVLVRKLDQLRLLVDDESFGG